MTGLRLVNDVLMLLMPLLLKLLVEHVDGSRGVDGSLAVNSAGPDFGGNGGPPAGIARAFGSGWSPLPPGARSIIDGPYGGFVFAALLGLAAGVKALLGAHYEYRMNVLANRWASFDRVFDLCVALAWTLPLPLPLLLLLLLLLLLSHVTADCK